MDLGIQVRRVRRIVVATDLRDDAPAVLATAVEYGRMFDASLDLVHVREDLVHTLTEGFVAAESQGGAVARQIDERLAALADRVTHDGLTCVTSTLDGVTHLELIRHAQRTGADLIIVGSHRHSALAQAVLGSGAERVAQKAGCPVLVVPTVH
jgi:nucleotide-binding universal stress UspA family protein